MLSDKHLELGNARRMVAEAELGVHPRFHGAEPEFLEPKDRQLSERLVRKVGQGRPAPEVQRRAEAPRGRRRIAVGQRMRALSEETLEAAQVELIRLERHHVTAAPSEQQLAVRA